MSAKGTKRQLEESGATENNKSPKAQADGESKSDGESKASKTTFKYQSGFGNHAESEALPHALPKGHNTPQKCPYGLRAEQLSGTSFTSPRTTNQCSWLYKIVPSAVHPAMKPATGADKNEFIINDSAKMKANPSQFRWMPPTIPGKDKPTDWIQGLKTVGGSGSAEMKNGFAVHMYTCNVSMTDKALHNSDGDLLIVPQQGALTIQTEFGFLHVPPRYICVIQRGIKFSVNIDGDSRGYVLEVYNGHFKLPDLGPIGANGLANARDFELPTAAYENRACKFVVMQKFLGELFTTTLSRSPFDTVAWHGNYVPFRYDLDLFCAVNSVTYDHMDPSIFTVLTCATNEPGVACADFVVFPPRWAVQEQTFRPPYYHRNCMSEYMGNITGKYEAKPEGFVPGGGSLHSCMVGHGPDAESYDKASKVDLKPIQLPVDSLAFMFESTFIMRLSDWAINTCPKDEKYNSCWDGMGKVEFDPNWKPSTEDTFHWFKK